MVNIVFVYVYKNLKSETKADENSDKKNDVNVNNLSTENSNTIVPTAAVNFSTERNNFLLPAAYERECQFEKVGILI